MKSGPAGCQRVLCEADRVGLSVQSTCHYKSWLLRGIWKPAKAIVGGFGAGSRVSGGLRAHCGSKEL